MFRCWVTAMEALVDESDIKIIGETRDGWKPADHPPICQTTVTTQKPDRAPARPRYSYVALIYMAIQQSKNKECTINEILYFVEDRYPYFVRGRGRWETSLRHALSTNDCFCKLNRVWTLHPNAGNMFENGTTDRRSRRFVCPVRERLRVDEAEVRRTAKAVNAARASDKVKQGDDDNASGLEQCNVHEDNSELTMHEIGFENKGFEFRKNAAVSNSTSRAATNDRTLSENNSPVSGKLKTAHSGTSSRESMPLPTAIAVTAQNTTAPLSSKKPDYNDVVQQIRLIAEGAILFLQTNCGYEKGLAGLVPTTNHERSTNSGAGMYAIKKNALSLSNNVQCHPHLTGEHQYQYQPSTMEHQGLAASSSDALRSNVTALPNASLPHTFAVEQQCDKFQYSPYRRHPLNDYPQQNIYAPAHFHGASQHQTHQTQQHGTAGSSSGAFRSNKTNLQTIAASGSGLQQEYQYAKNSEFANFAPYQANSNDFGSANMNPTLNSSDFNKQWIRVGDSHGATQYQTNQTQQLGVNASSSEIFCPNKTLPTTAANGGGSHQVYQYPENSVYADLVPFQADANHRSANTNPKFDSSTLNNQWVSAGDAVIDTESTEQFYSWHCP